MSEPVNLPDTSSRRAPAVLVVDDEADLRELLALTMVRLGLDVDAAETVARAREFLAANRYALCLTDMRLPDGVGLDLVREVAQGRYGEAFPIVVITAYGSTENAVAALKAGAFDYLTKPVDLEQLRLLVRSALAGESAGNAGSGTADIDRPAARLLGNAPSMLQLRAMIDRLARSMAPVAVYGESGSGKDLVARAIHDASARRGQPFVAVNCGAIPETLMEAEFFGYRKGAFTGAERDRDGFFQAASGGTLFLDEVAELPLAMQVKLLRAIQERRVRKVGATDEEPVDVRILSATHQELARRVAEGRFRQDLYYRLNVIELHVPSLRERVEDVPVLADAILRRLGERNHAAPASLTPGALDVLRQYSFPGNVRELENILERAVALAAQGELQPEDLMLPVTGTAPAIPAETIVDSARAENAPDVAPIEAAPGPTRGFELVEGVPSDLQAYVDELERDAIRAALEKTRSNRTAAAQLLGLTFRQLRYRMQRLGVK